MTQVLSTRSLQVDHGKRTILRDITVDFEEHLVHAILGPNGCGKTTLLRALTGATKLMTGDVTLDGRSVRRMPSRRIARELAVLWQGSPPTGDATVRHLVGLARYTHVPWWSLRQGAADRHQVDEAMRRTGVSDLADRIVSTLSGGERQRVWLAAALSQEPRVLLLDEPTTYLDIAHQLEMMDLVRNLNKESGITVIMVIHDLTHAARYADRCIILGDGLVQCDGPPSGALARESIAQHFHVDSWVTRDPETRQRSVQPRHMTHREA